VPAEIVEAYTRLFRGRGDCYGAWDGFCVKEPLTPAHFEAHLTTGPFIGVYPAFNVDGVTMTSWGCVDIDGKDHRLTEDEWDWDAMWRVASNLQTVLCVKGIPAYIEQTRNGYHVWVFPEDPYVEAVTMRRALQAACKAIGYSPKEVNPKSEHLGPTQVGNMVRLPYYGYLVEPKYERMMVDDTNLFYDLDHFLRIAECAAKDDLESVARLYQPKATTHTVNPEAGLEAQNILQMCSGKTFTVWRDGPLPGSDRSNTLVKLAYLAREDGLTAQAAYTIVKTADERWAHKFENRADGQEQLIKIVERAYAK
jgi:hypothetical protein